MQSPEVVIYVHPALSSRLASWVGVNWKELVHAQVRPEDHFVRNGDFSEASDFHVKARDWRFYWPPAQGETIGINVPEDGSGNAALHPRKENGCRQGETLGLYQWLARTPERPAEIVSLRFHARAQRGDGRLLIGLRLPLVIPRENRSPYAERLHALSAPHLYLPIREGMEVREYRPLDWVQPGASWRTYAIIWDWPEYATEQNHRNLEILLAGLGEVWVDDIEMFTWGQAMLGDKQNHE